MSNSNERRIRLITSIFLVFVVFILLFGVVPDQAVTPQVKSVEYGVSVHNLTAQGMQLISAANFKWIRVDDSQLSSAVNLTKNYSVKILAIIKGGGAVKNNVVNFNVWNATVKSLVSTYHSRVQAWEILNEPLLNFSDGNYVPFSASNYFKMLKYAYTIIKSIEPNSTVLGFGGIRVLNGNLQNFSWISSLISMGALNYCDAISLHFYSGNTSPVLVGFEYKSVLLQLRAIFGNESMWVTETGQTLGNGQAAYINIVYPLFSSFNIGHIFWYDFKDNPSDHGKLFGLVGDNYTKRESYTLLSNMNSMS